MEHERARALLAQQFEEGPLSGELQRELRDHVRGCGDCKSEYDRLFEVERALEGGAIVPRAALERLSVQVPEQKQRTSARRPHWSVRRRAAPLLALVASAAIAVMIALPNQEEWSARGGGRKAWVSVFVLRDAAAVPLGETLGTGDALLFAYTNLEGSGARHLAIAGRDAQGRVHWYHPAYRNEQDQPASLAIEHAADKELSEAVRAEHAPGALEICALFSDAPLSIAEIDRALEAGGGWPDVEILDCRKATVR